MKLRENVQELSKRKVIEIYVEYKDLGMPYKDALNLKNALKDYKVLSDDSKSKSEMAEDLKCSERTIDQKRSCLIKYNLIKPRKKGVTQKIESIRKLNTQKSKLNITYRFPYFNEELMKAANLDPAGEYFYKTEPRDKSILMTFLTPEEAKKYREKSQS